MTAISWIADTTIKLLWLATTKLAWLALGAVLAWVLKTWLDANVALRLREHKNAHYLHEFHQQGVQLRINFKTYKQDDPMSKHPELVYAYDDWNSLCEKWLSVLSPRWYESWIVNTTIMSTETRIDPSAVSTAFAFLIKRIEWLDRTRKESVWRWAWLWQSLPLRLLMVRWKLGLYRRQIVEPLRLK